MNRRSLFPLLLTTVMVLCRAQGESLDIPKSLARITNTAQEFNYRTPWLPGAMSGGSGTGWVVAKDRLMTNAHVVSNSRLLTVERENDARKYVATVEYIAHDCDLAILKVDDPRFWKDTKPLALGGVPQIESAVSVFGYPIGGERLSVTQGIVSRVDFRTYAHSVMDSHLCIQIDAAINPGNSGGPVLQKGKVVGVAFQGFSGDVAQNVGYMIPIPVVSHFLKDVEDGKYDRYMDLGVGIFALQNNGQRKALGLADDNLGVLVSSVPSRCVAAGKLEEGDVLLSVDGYPIESDGYVMLGSDRVMMAEVSERKFKGDPVVFKLLRGGKPMEVTVTFNEAWPFIYLAQSYDAPRYVLFAGLLFQPMNRNLMMAYKFNNARLHYMYGNFVQDEMFKERDEVIVLTSLLPDPINTYNDDVREEIVSKVNGKSIRNLADLAAAFAEKPEEYVIEFVGTERPVVLNRQQVELARERINQRYRVTAEQHLANNVAE